MCHRGCAYTVLQTVQRHGVYSAAYGTVHYKEPLKSFKIRVGHSHGFLLSRYCHDCAEFIHSFDSNRYSKILLIFGGVVRWCSLLPSVTAPWTDHCSADTSRSLIHVLTITALNYFA